MNATLRRGAAEKGLADARLTLGETTPVVAVRDVLKRLERNGRANGEAKLVIAPESTGATDLDRAIRLAADRVAADPRLDQSRVTEDTIQELTGFFGGLRDVIARYPIR